LFAEFRRAAKVREEAAAKKAAEYAAGTTKAARKRKLAEREKEEKQKSQVVITDVVAAGAKNVYEETGMLVEHDKLIKPPTQGQGKSNRPWKTNKLRLSSMKVSKGSKMSFAERMVEKERTQRVKVFAKQLVDERKADKQEARQKRKDKEERKKKNELASATYQQIKDSSKIKKMGKKQLKMIMKVDFDKLKAQKLPKGALKQRGSQGAL